MKKKMSGIKYHFSTPIPQKWWTHPLLRGSHWVLTTSLRILRMWTLLLRVGSICLSLFFYIYILNSAPNSFGFWLRSSLTLSWCVCVFSDDDEIPQELLLGKQQLNELGSESAKIKAMGITCRVRGTLLCGNKTPWNCTQSFVGFRLASVYDQSI